MKYYIRDETGDLMRVVGRLEEAKSIVSSRDGWTYQRVKVVKPKFKFEDALI